MSEQKANILKALNSGIFYVGIVAFIVLIIYALIINFVLAIHIALVCGISFLLCTILRKVIDAPRPNIRDSIYSKKSGESFPSRHVFSSCLIALSWLYVNFYVGIALCIMTLLLAFVRVSMGAHHVRDVIGAIFLSSLCCAAGYLIFI